MNSVPAQFTIVSRSTFGGMGGSPMFATNVAKALLLTLILLSTTVRAQISSTPTPSIEPLVVEGAANQVLGHTFTNPDAFVTERVLLDLPNPGLPIGGAYQLTASVHLIGVPAGALTTFTLWNYFPGDQAYFSKSMGAPGTPFGPLSSEDGLRRLVLPFDVMGQPIAPTRIKLLATLPPGATLELSNVQLRPFALLAGPRLWFSQREAGFLGAGLGTTVGLLGAAIGVLAARRRARTVVKALLAGTVILGFASLAFGVAALIFKQPYHVFYPLLLVGVIATFLPLALIPAMRSTLQTLDERRMAAIDL